jgi:hypothetical protein
MTSGYLTSGYGSPKNVGRIGLASSAPSLREGPPQNLAEWQAAADKLRGPKL